MSKKRKRRHQARSSDRRNTQPSQHGHVRGSDKPPRRKAKTHKKSLCRWFDSAPGHQGFAPNRSRLGVLFWGGSNLCGPTAAVVI